MPAKWRKGSKEEEDEEPADTPSALAATRSDTRADCMVKVWLRCEPYLHKQVRLVPF